MASSNSKLLELFVHILKLEVNGYNWVIFKNHFLFAAATASLRGHIDGVMTLILNEYRQSSNSSVLVFKFNVLRLLRMPIARYCLNVELVQVRSEVDSW
jgi:hypothetical protein